MQIGKENKVKRFLAFLFILLVVTMSFSSVQSANALGLNVEVTPENVRVDFDVIADYSSHTTVKLLVRFVVWLVEQYFSQLNISVTDDEILRERLIAAIEFKDPDLSVREISITLIPGYDNTTLKMSFVLDGCVEFISRCVGRSSDVAWVSEVCRADLGWKAFCSPMELSSGYGEAFKDFLSIFSFSYFIGLICNGTLNAFYELIKEYSTDLLEGIVGDLSQPDVVDFVRERIVKPFLDFIREHGMGFLIDVIDRFAEKFYDFVLGLKKTPMGWLIDDIISGGIVAIVRLNDFIDWVISWAGLLGFGGFIDEYGDAMFFANFLLSLIGLHYDILSEHLKYIGNVIVDMVEFSENVIYLLDRPEELERTCETINSSDKLIGLVGDFFGSMLLDMSGFSKPLEDWEVDYGEDYICFYYAIPVYVVYVFGESLAIDPEVRISLPKNYRVVDVTNDMLTFEVMYEVSDDQSEVVFVGSRGFRVSSLFVYLLAALVVFMLSVCFRLLRRNRRFRTIRVIYSDRRWIGSGERFI